MKRITAIIKGKVEAIPGVLDRKSNRIIRAVEQARDCALDSAESCKEEAEAIIDGLGEVAGQSDTEKLQEKLNEYANKLMEAEDWERMASKFDQLRLKLTEDVKLEEK